MTFFPIEQRYQSQGLAFSASQQPQREPVDLSDKEKSDSTIQTNSFFTSSFLVLLEKIQPKPVKSLELLYKAVMDKGVSRKVRKPKASKPKIIKENPIDPKISAITAKSLGMRDVELEDCLSRCDTDTLRKRMLIMLFQKRNRYSSREIQDLFHMDIDRPCETAAFLREVINFYFQHHQIHLRYFAPQAFYFLSPQAQQLYNKIHSINLENLGIPRQAFEIFYEEVRLIISNLGNSKSEYSLVRRDKRMHLNIEEKLLITLYHLKTGATFSATKAEFGLDLHESPNPILLAEGRKFIDKLNQNATSMSIEEIFQ